MPLPPYLICANLFICERALVEKDEVVSAIRMVSVFITPSPPPPELSTIVVSDAVPANAQIISAFVMADIKAMPGYLGWHKFELKLLNTLNEVTDLMSPLEQSFSSKFEGAPNSVGFIAMLRLVSCLK